MALASEFRSRSESWVSTLGLNRCRCLFVGCSSHVTYGTSLEVPQSFKMTLGGSAQEDVQGLKEWYIPVSVPDLVDEA